MYRTDGDVPPYSFSRVCQWRFTYMALGALLCVAGRSSTVGVGVGIAIVVAESAAYPLANVIVRGLYDFELQPYTRWTLWGVSNGLTGSDELAAAWFLPAIIVPTWRDSAP